MLACALCLACMQPTLAQHRRPQSKTEAGDQSSLRKEIDELKEGQRRILAELEELKKIIQMEQGDGAAAAAAPRPPANPTLNVSNEPFKGDKGARLAIIEYSDFQCPFCGSYSRDTFPQINENYIKTGKVRYIFRDFPLQGMHPFALQAAEAARCAGDQSKFWEMHDRLFANQRALSARDLSQSAQSLELDMAKFNQCLMDGKYRNGIRQSVAEGERLGVEGTPTFLIGVVGPDGQQVKVIRTLVGAMAYDNFRAVLEGLLNAQGK
ncbi:MAG TPA: DsbA family protein [Pyrinomonadaceae bacterium]|nr:DsbA family protein [Pyrinomonadaceae bacterium]